MNPNESITAKAIIYEIFKWLVCFSGFVVFGIVIWYITCISRGFYHSDCTDTILWAEAMLDGKTLMNPDFNYAGMLPFGGQLLMFPFVAMFGVSMKAQLAGMVLFALLFTLALIYMCRTMGLNARWCSLTVTAMLLVLSASPKLREIFWEHVIYYSLGIMFLMLGLGFVFAILNKNQISPRHYILLFVWTTLCSINGAQALAIYCLPVIGAIVIEMFLDMKKPFFSKAHIKEYIILGTMVTAMILGLIIAKFVNKDIASGYQLGYSQFDAMSNWSDNFMSILPSAFKLFGITISNQEMYSFKGIITLIKIMIVLVLLFTPIIMLFMYRKFEERSYKLMLLTHTLLSLVIIVCWVFGKLNSASWRLSPIFASSAILCVMLIRHIHKNKYSMRLVVAPSIIMALSFLIISVDVFALYKDNQSEANRQLESLGEFLEDKDLEYGYATFWNANSITLLTDSKVKVRVIKSTNTGDLIPRMYQSNINWYKDNSYDEYFLLLDTVEYDKYIYSETYAEPVTTYFYEDSYILVYDYNIMELTE